MWHFSWLAFYKVVELPVEFSFICYNCHQIRKERLKINTVEETRKE